MAIATTAEATYSSNIPGAVAPLLGLNPIDSVLQFHCRDIHRLRRRRWRQGCIEEQRIVLGAQFDIVIAAVRAQPSQVKPRGESVIKMTLPPTFLSKSFHRNSVLAASGLRCVGSKSAIVTPRKITTLGKPKPTYTAQLFVAGSEAAVSKLYQQLRTSKVASHQEALRRFEQVAPFSARDKLFIQGDAPDTVLIQVALHASKDDGDILDAFVQYVASLGGEAQAKRALSVAG